MRDGINRLFYISTGFAVGLTVTAHFIKENLTVTPTITFIEHPTETGVYYVDYNFDVNGKWIIKVFENGILTTADIFEMSVISGIVTYRGRVG